MSSPLSWRWHKIASRVANLISGFFGELDNTTNVIFQISIGPLSAFGAGFGIRLTNSDDKPVTWTLQSAMATAVDLARSSIGNHKLCAASGSLITRPLATRVELKVYLPSGPLCSIDHLKTAAVHGCLICWNVQQASRSYDGLKTAERNLFSEIWKIMTTNVIFQISIGGKMLRPVFEQMPRVFP